MCFLEEVIPYVIQKQLHIEHSVLSVNHLSKYKYHKPHKTTTVTVASNQFHVHRDLWHASRLRTRQSDSLCSSLWGLNVSPRVPWSFLHNVLTTGRTYVRHSHIQTLARLPTYVLTHLRTTYSKRATVQMEGVLHNMKPQQHCLFIYEGVAHRWQVDALGLLVGVEHGFI